MRLLVIGGTWFLGRVVVEEAVRAGHEVATFNRGRTGVDVPGARLLRGDRTNPGDLSRLRAAGPWDAVIDTSGYIPADVLAGARALDDQAGRYVFVSTVNVYEGWPVEPLSEASRLRACAADATEAADERWGDRYGRLKAGCEHAVEEAFGDRAVILRPGVILGRYEYIGRLPWWLRRFARGGQILGPGSPDRGIQPIDVRDVAAYALHEAADGPTGAFNVTAPYDHATYGEMLAACAHATGSDAEITWVDDDFLIDHGVTMWTELPLWRTYEGTWRIDSTRAHAAGLTCRPIADTVNDTWNWLTTGGQAVQNHRTSELGITPEQETQLLAEAAISARGNTPG